MKIYKLAQRMFDNFGMSEYVYNQFIKFYNDFIDDFMGYTGNDIEQKQKAIDSGKIIEIGKVDISSFIDLVIEKYGPINKEDYPRELSLSIVSVNNPRFKGVKMPILYIYNQTRNKINIVKTVDRIDEIRPNEYLESSFEHEIQHLILNMYRNVRQSKDVQTGTEGYFAQPHEIQAYTTQMAMMAFNDWKKLFETSMAKANREKLLEKIKYYRTSQGLSTIVKSLLLPNFKQFKSNQELRDKYLYYSTRNLETLLVKYLNALESRISGTLASMSSIFYKKASGISLWVDDLRDPTDPKIQKLYGSTGGEIWAKTVEEAIRYLEQGNVSSVSFDNDLGEGLKEGRHLADWIEEQAYFKKIPKLTWKIHSQNPEGAKGILAAMRNADRFWEQN